MSVPSLRKFEASYERCQHTFEAQCRGPAKGPNTERLSKAWQRARREFQKGYNDRLYMGLLIASLAVVVVFRFIIKFQLAEAAGWVSFVVLEVYPKLHPGSSLYDTSAWALTVRLWEGAVTVFLGFPGSGTLWLIGLVAAVVLRVVYRRRGGFGAGTGSGGVQGGGGRRSSGGGWIGRLLRSGTLAGPGGSSLGSRRKQTVLRDLDV